MSSIVNSSYSPPEYYCLLKDDPLNDEQKAKIKGFVEEHLLSNETSTDGYGRISQKNIFAAKRINGEASSEFEQFTAIRKTYDTYDAKNLAKAKLAMGEDAFNHFRATLKNPGLQAESLGLDPQKPAQIFAAQIFMKQTIQGMRLNRGIDDIHTLYRDKMAANKEYGQEKPISVKNQILKKNDPVKKLETGKPVTPLDVLLANTHFIEPRVVNTSTYAGVTKIVEEFGPPREETRQIIGNELRRISIDPELTHVTDALGTLIHKEKGNILFSDSREGVGSIGTSFGSGSSLDPTQGFYNRHHSIVMTSIVSPFKNKIISSAVGTFIHESLHFLFNCVIRNDSSPVEEDSDAEKKLDQALKADRIHRQSVNFETLPPKQKCAYENLVYSLENSMSYFQGGFNPASKEHLHTMRVEAIVRVMQEIANGAARADVAAVAPNLCQFYFEFSKPLLEKYIADNAHLFK